MKFKNCQFTPKNRRGLSSVVGALLFVVLMVATFAVLGVALNSQTDIVSTGRDVAEIGLKKQQEDFIIINVIQPPSGSLQIDINNLGQNAVEILGLIVTHSSDISGGFPTDVYDIPNDTSFVPPHNNSPVNILSTSNVQLPLAVGPGTINYEIKVISSLGKIVTTPVFCDSFTCSLGGGGGGGGPTGLIAQVFADGPNAVNTKTSTLVMFITNTGDVPLTGVAPLMGNPTTPGRECDDMWLPNVPVLPITQIDDVDPCDLDSAITSWDLAPSQTAMFKWDGRILGEINDVVIFCNQARGFDGVTPVNSNLSCDEITVIDPNDCGGCGEGGETIILIDDLLIRPSIFMIIPSPFGDTNGLQEYTGLWGVNIANPTDVDMDVSKVTIVAYPPGGDKEDNIFSGQKGTNQGFCEEISIIPSTGWDCPRDNTLMWENITSPITVPANSTTPFMVRVESDSLKGDSNLDAIIVQANVFSSLGSFGKSGYQSTMYKENSPLVNVYMSDEVDLRTGFTSDRIDIPENSTQTFSVVLADLDNDPATYINDDTKLIINVPRGWEFVEFVSSVGFDTPTNVTHSDGSTQLIGVTNTIIGDGGAIPAGVDARNMVFKAKAPDVDFHRLYIMHILAHGTVDVETGVVATPIELKTIGPLMEVVLQVDP